MKVLVDPLPNLDAKQKQLLKRIFLHFQMEGNYPSKKSLAVDFGWKSPNTGALLAPLFRKNCLEDIPGHGRYAISATGLKVLLKMGVHISPDLLVEKTPSAN